MLLLSLACAPRLDMPIIPVAAPPPDSSGGIIVDCTGGGDHTTITGAIRAAEPGDSIYVQPCTYEESIDFEGKALWIASTDGPEVTILQGDGTGSVVTAEAGEGDGTALVGFTVTGGGGSVRAAIHIDFASVLLEDLIVTGNRGIDAIYASSGDIQIVGSTFSDNRTTYGTVIYADRGGVLVKDSYVDCGSNSYGVYFSHGAGFVDGTTFTCDGSVAIGNIHAVAVIRGSTLHGDYYAEQEFDHYDDYVIIENTYVDGTVFQHYAALWLRNSVVRGGVELSEPSTYAVVEGSILFEGDCGITVDTGRITTRNNLFWGLGDNTCGITDPVGRDGNLSGDPLFVDADADDFHVGAGSPAIDAGPSGDGYDDVDGSRNDIGIYGGPHSQDGGW